MSSASSTAGYLVKESVFGGTDLEATPWIPEKNLEGDPGGEMTAVVYGSELLRLFISKTRGKDTTTTREYSGGGWSSIEVPMFHIAVEEQAKSEADVAASERVTLLARRYVSGSLSPEADARLAIATERVRRLLPRVTADDVETLETILDDLDSIKRRDTERRKRLGIE